MSTIKILIIEDEFIIADNLSFILKELGYECYKPIASKLLAMEFFEKETPDLVLLDINLKGKYDGIEIGSHLNEKKIPFIYITSNSDKETVDLAKKTHPLSYLLKPFTKDDIYTAIEIALDNPKKYEEETVSAITSPLLNNSLFIKSGSKYIKVKIEEITIIEADGKNVQIITVQKQKLAVKHSLEYMLNILSDANFVRVQRSFIINVQHLTAVNGEFVFIDQIAIPIGRLFKEELMSRLRTMS